MIINTEGSVIVSVSQGMGEQCVHVQINDKRSGIRVVDIEMDFEQFGRMVGSNGNSYTKKMVINTDDNIGKYREHKSEVIQFPQGVFLAYGDEEKEKAMKVANKIVKPYCVDGWEVMGYNKIWNHHYRQPDGKVAIDFVRWVDKNPDNKD